MHPEDRKSISRAIARSFRTRAEVREEFRLRAKDGSYRYYATTVRPVFDDGTEASGLVGVTQDVTERKRMEREIIEVSGRERQRIGRDLHDGLGQELTGVALMLRGLARRVERDCPEAVPAANEIVGLVNQSIETARGLARGLLPVSTEQGGLVAALGTLADRSRGLYGFEVRFSAEVWPQCTLEEALASHLYRIAQEAVTNAARHGQATVVDILLTFNGSRFLLKITDNGCGMPQSGPAGVGVGLKIMAYRANLIGAKLEIGANAPHGTIVRVIGEQSSPTTAL
jgi:signal transduction histidine kinase